MNKQISYSISNWLFITCAMVFCMVIVGGLTRLTNSGLSMVEWRPLIGTLPPLNDAEWERVFALYKSSPEYTKKHFWMNISDFKQIFFWEWFHRFLGRMVGLVYALPLVFFWTRNLIPNGYKRKLIIPLVLGGLQGLMGWYMVKSGLVERPDVSHFRLAAHLSLAFVIMAVLLWLALSLRPIKQHPHALLFKHGLIAAVFLATTIVWGAFTAGLDAGMIYNDVFPKMGQTWLPEIMIREGFSFSLLSENHASVQFMHRWLAIGSGLAVLSLWFHGLMKKHTFFTLHLLAAMVLVQFILGLATLYSSVALPLAAMHQSGGLLLFIFTVISLKKLKPV